MQEGREERRGKTGRQIRMSRVTEPRRLVCESGITIGYADDDIPKNEGSLRRRLNGQRHHLSDHKERWRENAIEC